MERGPREPSVPPDVAARLERMEQAIDSIAIEVERISEGQRFTTKLLAERSNGGRETAERSRDELTRCCSDAGDRHSARSRASSRRCFFTTVVVIALGIPIIRAFTRRWERGPRPPTNHRPTSPRDSSASSRRSKRSRSKSSASPKRSASRPSCMAEQHSAALPKLRRQPASTPRMPSVLIVDDEPNIRRMVGALLSARRLRGARRRRRRDGTRARARDRAGRRAARPHDAGRARWHGDAGARCARRCPTCRWS